MDIHETDKKIKHYEHIIKSDAIPSMDQNYLVKFEESCLKLREFTNMCQNNINDKLFGELTSILMHLKNKIKESPSIKLDDHSTTVDLKPNIAEPKVSLTEEKKTSFSIVPAFDIPKTPPELIKYRQKYRKETLTSLNLDHLPAIPEMSDNLKRSMLQRYDSENKSLLENKSIIRRQTLLMMDYTANLDVGEENDDVFTNQIAKPQNGTQNAKHKLFFTPNAKDKLKINYKNFKQNDLVKESRIDTIGNVNETLISVNEQKLQLDVTSSILSDPSYSYFHDSKAHLHFLSQNSILIPEKVTHPLVKRKSKVKKILLKSPQTKQDLKSKTTTHTKCKVESSQEPLSANDIFGDVVISPGFGKSFTDLKELMGKKDQGQSNIYSGRRRSSRNMHP